MWLIYRLNIFSIGILSTMFLNFGKSLILDLHTLTFLQNLWQVNYLTPSNYVNSGYSCIIYNSEISVIRTQPLMKLYRHNPWRFYYVFQFSTQPCCLFWNFSMWSNLRYPLHLLLESMNSSNVCSPIRLFSIGSLSKWNR